MKQKKIHLTKTYTHVSTLHRGVTARLWIFISIRVDVAAAAVAIAVAADRVMCAPILTVTNNLKFKNQKKKNKSDEFYFKNCKVLLFVKRIKNRGARKCVA